MAILKREIRTPQGSVTARDYFWLDLLESGQTSSTQHLARQLGVSLRTVQLALRRARADRKAAGPSMRKSEPVPPRLTPLFGIKPFTPQTRCADIHPGGIIPPVSRCVCMVCHQGGEFRS